MNSRDSRAIIAILRGVQPDEVEGIARMLVQKGITRIEVPLNSPEPFASIERIIAAVGGDAQVGAGTVLNVEDVERLSSLGGKMVVSPNYDHNVIRATKDAGMLSYPGVLTPTECFAALDAGADGLKFFPAFILGPTGISAIRSVLPADVETYAVGGVDADNFPIWLDAGVTGIGVGSSLYKPGWSTETIKTEATKIVAAYDACFD